MLAYSAEIASPALDNGRSGPNVLLTRVWASCHARLARCLGQPNGPHAAVGCAGAAWNYPRLRMLLWITKESRVSVG